MSSSTLIRLCGLAIVASGALFVIVALIDFYATLDPQGSTVLYGFVGLIDLLAGPLELLGLVGLYLYRPQATGILGLIAFTVAFFGGVLHAGSYWYEAFVVPTLAFVDFELLTFLQSETPQPFAFGVAFTFPLYLIGWVLLGIAFLRARLYPRAAVVLLIAVSLAFAVLSVVVSLLGPADVSSALTYVLIATGVLQNGVLAWLGFALWTGPGASGRSSDALTQSRPIS